MCLRLTVPKLTTSSATTILAWTTVSGKLPHLGAGRRGTRGSGGAGRPRRARCSTISATTTRVRTPRRAADRIRSAMPPSVKYGFMTSRRSLAASICSPIACDAATCPPGITCASAIGVEPAVGRRGEEPRQVGGQRAAMAAEARQERRLRLTHDGTGDAHHHVVERAVVEVVLDPRAARPRDRTVDDVQLAMVRAAELALPRVEPQAVREQAAPAGRQHVVDGDLRARRREAACTSPAPTSSGREPSPSTITRTSTPSASLRSSSAASRMPISPSRQPNMRMCTEDVAASTSARMRGKNSTPLDPGLDRRRRGPGERERGVARARAGPRAERRRRRLGAGRRHAGRRCGSGARRARQAGGLLGLECAVRAMSVPLTDAHARAARGVLRDGVGAHAHAARAPQQARGPCARARARASASGRPAARTSTRPSLRSLRSAFTRERRFGDAEERDPAAAAARGLRAGDRHEHRRRAASGAGSTGRARAARPSCRSSGRSGRAAAGRPAPARLRRCRPSAAGSGAGRRRRLVVVDDRRGRRRRRRSSPPSATTSRSSKRLGGLVERVVEHADVDRRLRAAGREHERARGRRRSPGRPSRSRRPSRTATRHGAPAGRRQRDGERAFAPARPRARPRLSATDSDGSGSSSAIVAVARRRRRPPRPTIASANVSLGSSSASGCDRDRDLLALASRRAAAAPNVSVPPRRRSPPSPPSRRPSGRRPTSRPRGGRRRA